MDTDSPTPPPPPLPPSSTHGKQALRTHPAPCPQHAALPFYTQPPIQETNPSQMAHAQNAEVPPMQNVPLSVLSHGDEGSPADGAEKSHPVQETDPAPQSSAQQHEQATQMVPSGQD